MGSRRDRMYIDQNWKSFGETSSLVDMDFVFLEEREEDFPGMFTEDYVGDEEEDGGSLTSGDHNETFWENQLQLLKGSLHRISSLELKIRNETREALNSSQNVGSTCLCPKRLVSGCRNCTLRNVSERLRNAGFDSAICKCKLSPDADRSSGPGEHKFVDVIMETNRSNSVTRIVIVPDFRSEFKMARSSENYNRIIKQLPEIFVGKSERLRNIIKIICVATKKDMQENGMHIPPWRKRKYMEAKWFSSCERYSLTYNVPENYPDKKPTTKTSMLTFVLLEKMPEVLSSIVAVV